jgi:cytochrome c551
MFKKISMVTIGLALVLSVSACGRGTPAPTTTNAPPASAAPGSAAPGSAAPPTSTAGAGTTTADAATVFKQNCVSCHGVDLGGGVGPNLQNVGSRLSADQIATTIADGRNAMPSFKAKLKSTEINALSVWLAAKK